MANSEVWMTAFAQILMIEVIRNDTYLYTGGVLLERNGSIAMVADIGVDWFCKGVLLGHILLCDFWKIGGYRKFSLHPAQSLKH